MFQLTINEKGGQATAQSFDKNEITIGRVQGNDVVLPKGNISKRHSRIVLKDGKFIIVDLKSTNGTYVNGKKITAPQVIKATDKIYIGDYTLQLTNGGAGAAADAKELPKAPSKSARDEVDLFGGDAAAEEPSDGGGQKSPSPGLIDDNFDQEFDVAADPPAKSPPKAGSTPAQQKKALPAAKPMEIDLPKDEDSEGGLDLAGEMGAEPEPPQDQELELDEPKAPVVPMKKKSGMPAPVAPARAQPSKVKAPPSASSIRGRSPIQDDGMEMDLGGEDDAPELDMPPSAKSSASPPAPVVLHPVPSPSSSQAVVVAAGPAAVAQAPALERLEAIRKLHIALVDELGLRGYELGVLTSMKDRATSTAKTIASRWQAQGRVAQSEDLDQLAKTVAGRAVDLDLIADLWQDEKVLQIIVTHDRQIWAERESVEPEGRIISSEDQVIDLIVRLGVLGGADPGADKPLVDVRLRDGSRVLASLPPLAFRGPSLSIRKATRDAYNLESFVEAGTLSEAMMKFLDFCLRAKKSMLLSLGPGVSGSATLNALASQMADDERVVTIEDSVELHLGNLKNVTALESKPDLGLKELIRHATMLQPDRVIIGGLHGPGVYDVLAALAGPLDGSLCAVSASSPHQAIERLAHVELATTFPESPIAAKRLVASAFPLVLQEHRFPEGGSRRITAISELVVEGEEVNVQDIFVFRPETIDESGVLTGTFAPTGHEPRFVQELVDRGDEIDMEIFKE
jgi:pilus assembly protein CpaF